MKKRSQESRPCKWCGKSVGVRGVVTHESYCLSNPERKSGAHAPNGGGVRLVESTLQRVQVMQGGKAVAEIIMYPDRPKAA